jgi:hypothetical protein
VAEIQWKGFNWKGAYSELSIKDLLTTLKGYGPMEILEFEKPGRFRGLLSISLSEKGGKIVSLYEFQTLSEESCETVRESLDELRRALGGKLQYVEDPAISSVNHTETDNLAFWGQMFREGRIDGVESETLSLKPGTSASEVERRVEEVRRSD